MTRPSALYLGAALALTACKSQPSVAPADAGDPEAKDGATVPGDTTAATSLAPAGDPTDEALTRIPKVLEGVAAVRHLDFKASIGAERQSTDDFKKFIEKELDKEFPPGKSAAVSKALHHIGLLRKEVDLGETLSSALVSQVGAYYDPEQSKFFVVMASQQAMMADAINAHELTHGLQDQHYDLRAYLGEGETKLDLSGDEATARRFVVEGEATLIMQAYSAYSMSGGALMLEEEKLLPMLDQQLAQVESMSVEQLLAANQQQAAQAAELGGDFAKAAEAMADLPPYVTVPLAVPYVRGMTTVYRVYRAGGWDAVAKLYAEPPTSSEQVLHPIEKLIETRDEPVRLTIDTKAPELKGWTVVDTDVLGELLWQVYFNLWGVDGVEPAAGWDGDQVVFLAKDDAQLGLMTTTWDSDDDAEEFRAAYAGSLAKRFGTPAGDAKMGLTQVERKDGTFVTVLRKGVNVAIVDGSTAKVGRKLAKKLLHAKRG